MPPLTRAVSEGHATDIIYIDPTFRDFQYDGGNLVKFLDYPQAGKKNLSRNIFFLNLFSVSFVLYITSTNYISTNTSTDTASAE